MSRWFIIALLLLVGCGSAGASTPDASLTAQEAQGQTLFLQQCNACHSLVDPNGGLGPTMIGIADIAESRVAGQDAATYLSRSITHPEEYIVPDYNNVMPVRNLSDEQVEAIVAYLLTLD